MTKSAEILFDEMPVFGMLDSHQYADEANNTVTDDRKVEVDKINGALYVRCVGVESVPDVDDYSLVRTSESP